MAKKKGCSLQRIIGIISGTFLVVLLCGLSYAFRILIEDEGPRPQRVIQNISVIRQQPPPPPVAKIKPPEPEIEKQEEIIEPEIDKVDNTSDQDEPKDVVKDTNLGLDAAGGTGSDDFGLMAKKGGKSLIDGGPLVIGNGGGNSIYGKYGWYTKKIEMEIRKQLLSRCDDLPSDNLHVLVKITLNEQGSITKYSIYDSTGNDRLDEAVKQAIKQTQAISEPPPEGMPRTVKLRISLG